MQSACSSFSGAEDSRQHSLFDYRFGRFHGAPLARRLPALTNSADNRLNQPVDALLFVAAHHAKTKLRLLLGAFADANGHLAAQIIFDERSFVAASLCIPRVDAKRGEIAGLALGSAGGGNQILWLVARRVADAVEFEPRERAKIRGGHALAHGVWQIQFNKTGNDPARDRHGLIPGSRCGCRFGALASVITRRTCSEAADQRPVLFLRFLRLIRGIFFVRNLRPIGHRPPHNLHGSISSKLIKARLGSPRLDAQIRGDLGASACLHGHRSRLVQELDAAQPERWFHQVTAVDPADGARVGSNLYVFIAPGKHVHALAVMQRAHSLADFGDAAQKRGIPFADKGFAQQFMLRPEQPGNERHQAEQRHCNEEFSLHALSPNAAPMTRIPCAPIAERTTRQMTAFNPGASPPPLTTLIVFTFVMIPRQSALFAEDCTRKSGGAGGTVSDSLFC